MKFFLSHEAEMIRRIPLGSSLMEDKLIWHYDSKGRFSVWSAYHIAFDRNLTISTNPEAASTSSGIEHNNWNFIWNQKLPNKIKIFACRMGTNILPTSENLMRRRIRTDDICCVCGKEVEIVMHMVKECAWANDSWESSPLNYLLQCPTGQIYSWLWEMSQ